MVQQTGTRFENTVFEGHLKMKDYITAPRTVSLKEIKQSGFGLSAALYREFNPKNKNLRRVRDFMARALDNTADLGYEVGSDAYVDKSPYLFMRTRAMQSASYIPDFSASSSTEHIVPQAFIQMNLRKGDLLIAKDGEVGEIVILDKDYPNMMVSSAIYKLPVGEHPLYLLAFCKSDVFREQIDFMIPKGSTLRHGKTKFLDCKIPMPKLNPDDTIKYVELLTQAIIDKEIAIRNRHAHALAYIEAELLNCQADRAYTYSMPDIHEIMDVGRMDTNRYCKAYKDFRHLIENYKNGYSTYEMLGYKAKRGQNLQITAIGESIYSDTCHDGFYTLILSKNLSAEGRILEHLYLGNNNELNVLNKGEIVFSVRGNLGRSFVVLDSSDQYITNIDSIIFYGNANVQKSCFIHMMLDLYRKKDFIKKIGIYGSGAESLTMYQLLDIPFPNFPAEAEKRVAQFIIQIQSIARQISIYILLPYMTAVLTRRRASTIWIRR